MSTFASFFVQPGAPAPRSVVVLRALMLGDLLCATPALRALRAGLPRAHITLVGLPWAREWAARLRSVDEFVELPGWPGLPERPQADAATRAAFVAQMRGRRFDLALQMHGSGEVVNALLASWQPLAQAGFGQPADTGAGGTAAPARLHFISWPHGGSEVDRLLALTAHLGLAEQGRQLDYPLRPGDFRQARPLRPQQPYAVVHPGSQWPSRRWPVERFAAVADALAASGLEIVITGTAQEAELGEALIAAMRHPATLLAGRTSLWTLGALVADARLVLCNDTGISHIAAALRTPSVVVASGSDVPRWAPADALRHRVLWHQLPCRPCAHAVCPQPEPCALGVGSAAVARVALQMQAQTQGLAHD